MEFLWLSIGSLVGAIISCILHYKGTSYGTLRIDRSNPEKDTYRIVINGDISDLVAKKHVVLKVDPNADLSQD